MSLTDEQISTLNFDSLQTFDSDQKSLFVNNIDSSIGQTLAHTTTSVPQLTTTINMSKNLIEKSKQSLEVNIQGEYQQNTSKINPNGTVGEDDDFIPPEPPARTDYGKKALVNSF